MCYKVASLIEANDKHYNEIVRIGDPSSAHVFLNKEEVVVGYLWYDYLMEDDTALYIDYIQAKDVRCRYGTNMIAHLFGHFDITTIHGECGDEQKGFWIKIGAEVPEEYSDPDREMYDFVLSKDSFYSIYKGE